MIVKVLKHKDGGRMKMSNKSKLFSLMEQYEINDSKVITEFDNEILKEMNLFGLHSPEGIRSLLNDFKRIIIKKGA